jgi:hypothetical protein
MSARFTIEFDDEEERELKEAIVDAAAARLSTLATRSFDRVVAEQLDLLRPEIAARAGTLVDEALEDSAIGLPTMIMERVRFEIQERLPARLEQTIQASIRAMAVEEAERMERERPRGRGRRWGRKR